MAEPKAKPGGRGAARGVLVLVLLSPSHPVAAKGVPVDGSPSPPHPVGAARRRPSPKGEGEVWGMTLLRLLSRRCGEGAGRPGLARCFDSFTVSTKQTCPAQPFSTRPPAGGPCFGPYRIIRRGHCCPGRGRDMAQPAVRSIGARRANGGHPSTSMRTPAVSIPQASSLDHSPPTSGRWIRRPPHRRDGQESGTGPSADGL